jgi:hypothetical protein
MALALIVGIIALPVILMTVLRINAPLVFLSVCLGNVLLQFVGKEAVDFVNLFLPGNTVASKMTVQLALVLIPVVLTMIFMIKSVQGNRLVFNILPAIGTSFLLLFIVKPLLSSSVNGQIETSTLWSPIEQMQELIIGVSSLLCLFFLWVQRPKSNEHGKKHH